MFWIVKHGVCYTGMGAWEGLASDDDIWKAVGFLSHLKDLPPEVAAEWRGQQPPSGEQALPEIDKPDSPHLLAPKIKARLYFAIASDDDKREPEVKNKLKGALAAANVPAEIEVYPNALHG